jgi:hypothetical protein
MSAGDAIGGHSWLALTVTLVVLVVIQVFVVRLATWQPFALSNPVRAPRSAPYQLVVSTVLCLFVTIHYYGTLDAQAEQSDIWRFGLAIALSLVLGIPVLLLISDWIGMATVISAATMLVVNVAWFVLSPDTARRYIFLTIPLFLSLSWMVSVIADIIGPHLWNRWELTRYNAFITGLLLLLAFHCLIILRSYNVW